VEAVILIGIQGSGKSTFYKEKFADTHVRINLDMLRTKNREKVLLEACLEAKIRFVVDKVNASREERARYIGEAKRFGFRVVGYYLRSDLKSAMERNNRRTGKSRIPDKGLFDSAKRLQIPTYDEGFDELNYVWIDQERRFVTETWLATDINRSAALLADIGKE
jgi:predicted kinase